MTQSPSTPRHISPELSLAMCAAWLSATEQHKIDPSGFEPQSSLDARLAWAKSRNLSIGCVYARAGKRQAASMEQQVLDCAAHGAKHSVYVPSEFVCYDACRGQGRPSRDGLCRINDILGKSIATVLIVHCLSRLFRSSRKGLSFFERRLLAEGLRGLSVHSDLDTDNAPAFRMLADIHAQLNSFRTF